MSFLRRLLRAFMNVLKFSAVTIIVAGNLCTSIFAILTMTNLIMTIHH